MFWEGRLDSGEVLLEEVDESVGGGVMGVDLCGILELRFDLLGQLFAQFDSNDARVDTHRGDKRGLVQRTPNKTVSFGLYV